MARTLLLATIAGMAAGSSDAQFSLTLLHNGDAESQVISAPGQPDFGGVARFKTLVDQLRAGATTDGVLTIAAGDNFLAGPEYTVGVNDGVFYDAVAFAAIGYDAAAIGNHEFDFGPDVLEQFIVDGAANLSPATFVSTNLDFAGEPGLLAQQALGRISSFQVFSFSGTQVGVIGATTPNLPFISSPRDTVVNEMVAAEVQADINTLQALGVNIIVLVSHLQGIDEEAAIVAATTGLDIVVAGGGDNLLSNTALLVPGDASQGAYPRVESDLSGRDVAIVSTDGNFKYVGRLIANFDAAGEITSIDPASDPVRVSGVAPDAVVEDPTLLAAVVDPVLAGVAALDQNVLAFSEVGLDGVRDNIRGRETNLGNLIGDAFLYSANLRAASFGLGAADVAFANGGGVRNNNLLPAGDFTELDSFDVLPFLNFLSIIENVSPERLKLICENAYGSITATGPVGSLTGRFGQIGGMTVEFNLIGDAPQYDFDAGPINITNPGSRVKRIVLSDGTVIVEDGQIAPTARSVNIAIVDFLARGGDQYPLNDLAFTSVGVTYQQSLAEYAAALGTITAAQYPEGGEGRIVDLWQRCPADSNADGSLTKDDFNAWLSLFNTGNSGADVNRNGVNEPGDFTAWVVAYNEAGC
ncbi:MAG: 5'-nucleotidase C-terminal domain-containing protein [Phycisphaerales bacterium]